MNDTQTRCDAISVGIAFTARRATPGNIVHVDDRVECAPEDAPGD